MGAVILCNSGRFLGHKYSMKGIDYVFSCPVSEELQKQISGTPLNSNTTQVVVVTEGDKLVAIERSGLFKTELGRAEVPAKLKDGIWVPTWLRSTAGIATTVAASAVAGFGLFALGRKVLGGDAE